MPAFSAVPQPHTLSATKEQAPYQARAAMNWAIWGGSQPTRKGSVVFELICHSLLRYAESRARRAAHGRFLDSCRGSPRPGHRPLESCRGLPEPARAEPWLLVRVGQTDDARRTREAQIEDGRTLTTEPAVVVIAAARCAASERERRHLTGEGRQCAHHPGRARHHRLAHASISPAIHLRFAD